MMTRCISLLLCAVAFTIGNLRNVMFQKSHHMNKNASFLPAKTLISIHRLRSMSSLNFTLLASSLFASSEIIARADDMGDVGMEINDEDDFLAEILAEERREAEEMAKLEAEMKELEAMKAQHAEMHRNNGEKMKPGSRNNMGGGGMPGGTKSGVGKGNEQFQNIEEELRKKEAEAAEAKRQQETDEEKEDETEKMSEAEREKAEEVARQREAKFNAEMERIQDEKKRKALQRQKQRDGQIVRKILRQSEKTKHYSVLGMKCKWGEIDLSPLPFSICKLSAGDIKRAYRKIAKTVHPDKNRDGRAHIAFDALERSAAILMDPKQKKDYDAKLARQRSETVQNFVKGLQSTWRTVGTILKVMGPFATPFLILLALAI